jgi:hypothetical protein
MGRLALLYLAAAVIGAVYSVWSYRLMGHPSSEIKRAQGSLGFSFGLFVAFGGGAGSAVATYLWATHVG